VHKELGCMFYFALDPDPRVFDHTRLESKEEGLSRAKVSLTLSSLILFVPHNPGSGTVCTENLQKKIKQLRTLWTVCPGQSLLLQ